ncbi:MAG: hypothetical protein ABI882_00250 [Acidobacteriota bacterium]
MGTVWRKLAPIHGRTGQMVPWLIAGAILIYFVWVALLGVQTLGLEYDEALLQHGAVHILNSRSEPTFAHDWGSWLRFAGRYWPLTVLPYAGAVKSYLVLVPFALFGPKLIVIRVISALLGAFGLFGIARLLRMQVSAAVAAAVALTLAMQPAYLLHTLYDNSLFGFWMASLGMISLALQAYIVRRTMLAAVCLGFTFGIGIWTRVNFVWFLASGLLAAVIAFRRRPLVPWRHLAAMTVSGLIAAMPMVVYQYRSRLGVLRFMATQRSELDSASLLRSRLRTLAETLIVNDENRAIWGESTVPYLLSYILALILLLALLQCLLVNDRDDAQLTAWKRASALSFLFLALFLCTSRLPVRGHHLIALVPIGAVVVVLALKSLAARWRFGKLLATVVALIYFASALSWDVIAVKGVRTTGGVKAWSDAIGPLADHLQSQYSGREIKILDWGLQNNLYVLSNGRIQSREFFWGATAEKTGFNRSWADEIATGGVFLTNSVGNQSFPAATQGLLAALNASQRPYQRVNFYERSGAPYAEIIEVR